MVAATVPTTPAILAAILLATAEAHGAALAPVLDGIHWGETSTAIAHELGTRAMRLAPPIEFGDSYVDVAIRGEMIAGYPFTVYFQMAKESHRLMRVMLVRQPHGANPAAFHALVDALTQDYGAAAESCTLRASPRTGYQAAVERVWRPDDMTVRATFRDTTLEAAEGCVAAAAGACGLTGRLYVQIMPGQASCE